MADYKFEASAPFYATVGASDVAVEKARELVADLRGRYESKSFAELAKEHVSARREEAKETQAKIEAQLKDLQADIKALPSKVDFKALQVDFKAIPAKVEAQFNELKDVKALQAKIEAQLNDLQAEVKEFPGKIEARYKQLVAEYRAKVNEGVKEQRETFAGYATRGESVVAKLRTKKPAAKTAPAKKAPAKKAPAKKAPAKKASA